MIPIRLPDDIVDRILEISTARQELKQQHGVEDRIISQKWDPVLIHFHGLYAEAAVAVYLGLMPQLDISVRGDGGYGDLELPTGEKMQVKMSWQADWSFALRSGDPNDMKDRFGWLVVPVSRKDEKLDQGVQVVGWFESIVAKMFGDWQQRDFGYGERAVIPYDRLSPPETFEEMYMQ